MKLAIFALAFVKVSSCFKTMELDELKLEVSHKYEHDHVYCMQNDIPNRLDNGPEIITEDLHCEVLSQHTVCATTCEDVKKVEFECDCNKKFMVITLFDKNACHWKTIMDVPCPQTQLPDSSATNISISEIESLTDDVETEVLPMVHDFINPEISSEEGDIEYDIESEFETTNRMNGTCSKLGESWNCSNSNSIG